VSGDEEASSHVRWARSQNSRSGGRIPEGANFPGLRRVTIVMALVTALAMAACQEAPGPQPTESSPRMDQSPTPTASAEPTELREPTTAASPIADPPCTLGTPTNLGPGLNTPGFDGGPTPSFDGLRLYFVSDQTGSEGGDIWVAERLSVDGEFGPPLNLGPGVNSAANEGAPTLSRDELVLFFDRDDGAIWSATRLSVNESFGPAERIGDEVNSQFAGFPALSADGLALLFTSQRLGGQGDLDIWRATRAGPSEPFVAVENLESINKASADAMATLSATSLIVVFASTREGSIGDFDLWMAVRPDAESPFAMPVNLGPDVNTEGFEGRPHLSSDSSVLFFMSDRPGGEGDMDLWQVTIDCTEPSAAANGKQGSL
jgi:hypothetical protein